MIGRHLPVRLAALAIIALTLAQGLSAQEPESPLYRRVFVPRQVLADQIGGLIPLRRDEFERRTSAFEGGAAEMRQPAEVSIEQGVFTARLVAGRLESGIAQLSVVCSSRQPALLDLNPCSLTCTQAAWIGRSEPAILGVDTSGRLQCLVQQSGTLELSWSLPADQSAINLPATNLAATDKAASEQSLSLSPVPEQPAFRLTLPPAARRRLEILAPPDVQLELAGSIAQQPQKVEGSGHNLWKFELSAQREFHLVARSTAEFTSDRRSLLARENSVYSLTGATLELESKWVVDVQDRPVDAIPLHLDAPLHVTSVHLNDHEVALESEPASTAGGPSLAVVRLPAPLSAGRHHLQILATAACNLSKPAPLPRIQLGQALLQDALWEVTAPDWLEVTARPKGDCLQIQSSSTTGTSSDRFVFHAFSAGGSVEVVSRPSPRPLSERSGTQITVEGNQVLGVFIAELAGQGREVFEVEAEIPRQWIIDSVEAVPASMLGDRTLAPRGQSSQRLNIQLALPIISGRPLKLIVRGHYRRPANGELRGRGSLEMARFPAATPSRRLLSIRTSDPGVEMRLRGDDDLVRLSPNDQSPADRELLDSVSGTTVFDAETVGERLIARFQPAAASYRGDVLLQTQIGPDELQQIASIKCHPEATAVGSVMVRMVPPPSGPVRWLLAGDEPRELAAVSEPDSSPKDAALFRLLLPRPTSAPLEIQGQWSAEPGSPLSLLWLPDANRQATLVEIYSAEGIPELGTEGLRSLPLPAAQPQQAPCVARFSYETGQPAALRVRHHAHFGALPQVRVESMDVTSQLTFGGRFEHDVKITVTDAHASTLSLRLPEEIIDLRLVDRGEELALQRTATAEFRIPLGAARGPRELRLRYSSPAAARRLWPIQKIAASIPSLDFPATSQTWSLVLPPGIAPFARRRAGIRVEHSTTADGAVVAQQKAVRDRSPSNEFLRAAQWLFGGLNLAARTGWFSPLAGKPATDGSFRGWQVFTQDLQPGEKAELTIYHVPILLVCSLALVLSLPLVGQWLVRQPMWLALFAGVLLASTLVIIPPWSWLTLGALVGLILGAAWRWAADRVTGNSMRVPSPSVSAVATATFLLALVLWSAREANAAPPENGNVSGRVIYPIDDDGQPQGDYVYLDRAVYEAVLRASSPADTKSPDWLLGTAQYEIKGDLPLRSDRPGAVEMGIEMQVHVFQEHAELVLGFRRDEILLVGGKSTLDGMPISLAWQESGVGLVVPMVEKGEHHLKLTVAARCAFADGQLRLRTAIPPAAITKVLAPQAVSVPGASRETATGASFVTYSLPSAQRLSLQWPAAEAAASAAASSEVEKLLLWKIRPGSIVVEGLFRFRSNAEPIKELRLRPDPALRLLPSLAPATVESVATSEEAGGMVLVQFGEPRREGQFRLNWLWPESPSMGTLVLPRIEVHGAALTRDWLALATERGLTLGELRGAPRPIDVAEFQRAWAADLSPLPSAAAEASPNGVRIEASVRPTPANPAASETLEWSISRAGAILRANYRLTNVSRTRFEHRLSLPKSLQVASVKVLQSQREAAVRHWQSTDGQLSISLLESPLPEQTLVIHGELAVPAAATEISLPRPQLQEVDFTSSQVRIYRQSDVDLSVKSASGGLTKIQPEAADLSSRLGRLAAQFDANTPSAPAELIVARRPNQARLTGRALLKVTHADGDWQAALDLNLNIQNGVLDRVRLLLDQDWSEAVTIEPPWAHEWEQATGDGRQLLTLIPPTGLTGRVHVRLTAPLSAESGGIEAPSLRLLDAEKIEQFVLLDRGSDAAPIDWETIGLVAVESAPAELGAMPPSLVLHRVLAEAYRALARLRPVAKSSAEISLATLKTRFQNSQAITTANYDVIYVGSDDLSFELPPDSRLLQVLVDEQPSLVKQVGLRSWAIARRSELLPQSLTVEYESAVPLGTHPGSIRLGAPQFTGVAPRTTLWTFDDSTSNRAGEPAWSPIEQTDANEECSAAEAALLRLESCARALEAVQASRGSYVPGSIVSEAYHRWQAELDRSNEQLRSLELPVDSANNLNARRQAALAAAANARQRLIQAGILSEEDAAVASARLLPPADLSRPYRLTAAPYLDMQFAGSQSQTMSFPWRPFIAGLVLVGAFVFPIAARRMVAQYSSAAIAPAAFALIGLAWWALAPTGWLGWGLLAVAGWLALARSRTKHPASSGSTIQRLSTLR